MPAERAPLPLGPSRMTPLRVLIVDDDPEIARMLARSLSRRGFQIDCTRSADEALAQAGKTPYDAAILDLVMPGRDGAELSSALRSRIPGLVVAFLTGYANSPLVEQARRGGAAVFSKPVAVHEIVDFLEAQLGKS